MDHIFSMLEQYANNLEEEIEGRTRELVEEKKKSDILLQRMLPKWANSLKFSKLSAHSTMQHLLLLFHHSSLPISFSKCSSMKNICRDFMRPIQRFLRSVATSVRGWSSSVLSEVVARKLLMSIHPPRSSSSCTRNAVERLFVRCSTSLGNQAGPNWS